MYLAKELKHTVSLNPVAEWYRAVKSNEESPERAILHRYSVTMGNM